MPRGAVRTGRALTLERGGPIHLLRGVRWPSGQAQVCKTCYGGSIPPRTSNPRRHTTRASTPRTTRPRCRRPVRHSRPETAVTPWLTSAVRGLPRTLAGGEAVTEGRADRICVGSCGRALMAGPARDAIASRLLQPPGRDAAFLRSPLPLLLARGLAGGEGWRPCDAPAFTTTSGARSWAPARRHLERVTDARPRQQGAAGQRCCASWHPLLTGRAW